MSPSALVKDSLRREKIPLWFQQIQLNELEVDDVTDRSGILPNINHLSS